MKQTFNSATSSLALDSAMVCLNCLNGEELRTLIDAANDKRNERVDKHVKAIREAIAAALDDGFDISIYRAFGNSVEEVSIDSANYYLEIM